jgi:hypothetical protein
VSRYVNCGLDPIARIGTHLTSSYLPLTIGDNGADFDTGGARSESDLDSARVLAYAFVEDIPYRKWGLLYCGGKHVEKVPQLAICANLEACATDFYRAFREPD